MKLEQINPIFVCKLWSQIGPMLAKALEHSAGEYNIDQLKFMLVRGEQILMVLSDENDQIHGAFCVVFQNYPNDRIVFVTAVGGRRIATAENWIQLEEWCRVNGATKIRGAAYESVARLWFQKFGVEQRYIMVEKAL